MPNRRRITLTLLASVALSGAALAMPFRHRASPEAWSEVAGTPGTRQHEIRVAADYYAIQALKLWNFDNRTCSLQLEQSALNAPGPGALDPVRFCEPKSAQSWKRADVGAGNFVTGISVCTRRRLDAGRKVHGVELWAASLKADGKLKAAPKSVRLEFAGCEKWSAKRACPSGSVATVLRAHVEGDEGLTGVALGCREIETDNAQKPTP